MNTARLILLATVALIPFSGMSLASLQAGDTIRFVDREGGGPGGEFGVQMWTGSSWTADLFRTFCLERNEFISFGTSYVIDSIVNEARGGGQGGQDTATGDTLSARTAYLYYNFAQGTLTGYDYTPSASSHSADADRLQNAIWRLENETNNISASDISSSHPDAEFYNLATSWEAGATQSDIDFVLGRVRAINPSRNGTRAQSMLYVIPEPGTIAIWSALGLIGAVALRRRTSK